MTDQLEALRANVVAAVQSELNRYNQQVSGEIQRLRTELATERAARVRTEEQLVAFAGAAARRQHEVDARIGWIADATNKGLTAAVESAAGPVVKQLEHRQDGLERSLAGLDGIVRKVDDQAGRIVAHINAVTEATGARLDEVSAQAAMQQAEVSNVVGQRVEQAEARIDERVLATEARINEQVGQRIADIDAYVGRVSVGLDEAVTTLSDRLAGTDARTAEIIASLDAFTGRLDAVDVAALDDLKDRFGGVAGEVELIRIETERFQESMGGSMDKALGRIVELETQLQDQNLDVEIAVQLERLEEVERALIALDPAQFVRHTDTVSNGATDTVSNGATDEVVAPASSPFSVPVPFSPPR